MGKQRNPGLTQVRFKPWFDFLSIKKKILMIHKVGILLDFNDEGIEISILL